MDKMKIEHAALYVNDLERALKFYADYFGGKPGALYHNPRTGFRSYFVSFEDGARLEIMSRETDLEDLPKPAARTGFAHLCFAVGSKEKVDAMTEQWKKDGYTIVSGPRTTGDGYYETCMLDAEGNQIEITV